MLSTLGWIHATFKNPVAAAGTLKTTYVFYPFTYQDLEKTDPDVSDEREILSVRSMQPTWYIP